MNKKNKNLINTSTNFIDESMDHFQINDAKIDNIKYDEYVYKREYDTRFDMDEFNKSSLSVRPAKRNFQSVNDHSNRIAEKRGKMDNDNNLTNKSFKSNNVNPLPKKINNSGITQNLSNSLINANNNSHLNKINSNKSNENSFITNYELDKTNLNIDYTPKIYMGDKNKKNKVAYFSDDESSNNNAKNYENVERLDGPEYKYYLVKINSGFHTLDINYVYYADIKSIGEQVDTDNAIDGENKMIFHRGPPLTINNHYKMKLKRLKRMHEYFLSGKYESINN